MREAESWLISLRLWTKTIHEITRMMPWLPRNKGHSTVSKWAVLISHVERF